MHGLKDLGERSLGHVGTLNLPHRYLLHPLRRASQGAVPDQLDLNPIAIGYWHLFFERSG